MSQTTNFEAGDVPVVPSSSDNSAHQARQTLSNEFVGAGAVIGAAAASALKGDGKQGTANPATGTSEAEAAGQIAGKSVLRGAAEAIANGTASPSEGSSIAEKIKNAIKDGMQNGASDGSRHGQLERVADGISNSIKSIDFDYKFKVTDKDRAEAKERMAKELSDLIPDADRTLLKEMQGAIIDGNLDQLKASLKKLADDPDPAKMGKFLKALNSQFEKQGWGNVELSKDSQGNVLLYEKNGSTAVSINAKTGETSLRAVERQADGSMLLKPGEIINREPADVMRSVGDSATRGVVGPRFLPLENSTYKDQYFKKLHGGSGGGGGGGGDSSPAPTAPSIERSTIPEGLRHMHENLNNLPSDSKKKEK